MSGKMFPDQQFLEFVVKALVDNPDSVEVSRKVDDLGVLLLLKVAPSDVGQVIGRDGHNAKAIRTLLRSIGTKNNARVNLKIDDPRVVGSHDLWGGTFQQGFFRSQN